MFLSPLLTEYSSVILLEADKLVICNIILYCTATYVDYPALPFLVVQLFHDLEACGRKCPSKEYIRKVEDAYEMLGGLEEKKALLEKYKDLYNKPSSSDRKQGRLFKKAAKKAGQSCGPCNPFIYPMILNHF